MLQRQPEEEESVSYSTSCVPPDHGRPDDLRAVRTSVVRFPTLFGTSSGFTRVTDFWDRALFERNIRARRPRGKSVKTLSGQADKMFASNKIRTASVNRFNKTSFERIMTEFSDELNEKVCFYNLPPALPRDFNPRTHERSKSFCKNLLKCGNHNNNNYYFNDCKSKMKQKSKNIFKKIILINSYLERNKIKVNYNDNKKYMESKIKIIDRRLNLTKLYLKFQNRIYERKKQNYLKVKKNYVYKNSEYFSRDRTKKRKYIEKLFHKQIKFNRNILTVNNYNVTNKLNEFQYLNENGNKYDIHSDIPSNLYQNNNNMVENDDVLFDFNTNNLDALTETDWINLFFEFPDGHKMKFKTRKKAMLRYSMEAFTARMGYTSIHDLKFTHNGKAIYYNETPESLKMNDDESIQVNNL